jgi:glutathione S-transferase
MKLYVSPGAPSPRRVLMFLVEKNITGIDLVNVDLNAQEHKGQAYRAKSPLAKVPALELDDGRVLTETRAICTYLEGLYPEPNLMGQWTLTSAPSSRWPTAACRAVPAGQHCQHGPPHPPGSCTAGAAAVSRVRSVAVAQGARSCRVVRPRAGAPDLAGRGAFLHCRHHGLLCH